MMTIFVIVMVCVVAITVMALLLRRSRRELHHEQETSKRLFDELTSARMRVERLNLTLINMRRIREDADEQEQAVNTASDDDLVDRANNLFGVRHESANDTV